MKVQGENRNIGFYEILKPLAVVGGGVALYAASRYLPIVGQVGQALKDYVVEYQIDLLMNQMKEFYITALTIGAVAVGVVAMLFTLMFPVIAILYDLH